METETPKNTPFLELAWNRVATLSNHSGKRNAGFFKMRRWIAYLGVLATFFAILTQLFNTQIEDYAIVGIIAKVVFIATPILASTLAAFASKKYANGDWWVTRGAAEAIKKEIYFYRTISPKETRRQKLETAMSDIQRQVFRALGGVFSFEKYTGPVPEGHDPNNPNSDPGFNDLTGDQYFTYRLEDQLHWHNGRINRYKRERDRLTVLILVIGALGTVLATIGGQAAIWVAFTASITSALIGWEQIRNIEGIIRNYSKVVLELNILKDHWLNLEPAEKTQAEFEKLVNGCEQVLWAQNTEYIKAMQDVLQENNLEEQAKLADDIAKETVVTARRTTKSIEESAVQIISGTLSDTGQQVEQTFQATLGSLADGASELVRKQLDSAGQVVTEAAQDFVDGAPTLTSALAQAAQQNTQVEVGRDTSKEELNQILASYPKTGDVKG